MRLRILEQQPGELTAKAPQLVRQLEELTGLQLLAPDPLEKAKARPKIPVAPLTFEHKALEGAVANSRKEVERIRKLMLEQFDQVLKG